MKSGHETHTPQAFPTPRPKNKEKLISFSVPMLGRDEPDELGEGTIRAAFGDGSGCEPLATGGDPLPQLGAVHEEAVEKETVGTTHRLRRDGKYEIPVKTT